MIKPGTPMGLASIRALAKEHLAAESISDVTRFTTRFTFHFMGGDWLRRYGQTLFDYRVKDPAFDGTHLDLMLVDNTRGRRVGHATLFCLPRGRFKHQRFWRVVTRSGARTLLKTTLADVPAVAEASRVVMHGYTESPRYVERHAEATLPMAALQRYHTFLTSLAACCAKCRVPLLIEPMAATMLSEDLMARTELPETDLSPTERDAVGCTRPQSAGSERMARALGLAEIRGLYNERTLGKVFVSVPGLACRQTYGQPSDPCP